MILGGLTSEIPTALEPSPNHEPLIAQAFTFDFWAGATPMLQIEVMYQKTIYCLEFQLYTCELKYHILNM